MMTLEIGRGGNERMGMMALRDRSRTWNCGFLGSDKAFRNSAKIFFLHLQIQQVDTVSFVNRKVNRDKRNIEQPKKGEGLQRETVKTPGVCNRRRRQESAES